MLLFMEQFLLESKDFPITILTYEIQMNPLGTNVDIKIFKKSGDFLGAEDDASQWTKIADTSLFEGRGTSAPQVFRDGNFVGINLGQIRGECDKWWYTQ
jgi:hypothetical protein